MVWRAVASGKDVERSRFETPAMRVLLLGWSVWLLGSWAMTLSLDSPTPAGRLMVFMALLGLMLLWPAVRLSLGAPAAERVRPIRFALGETLVEWFCLMLVLQAVVWPLRFSSHWGLGQTLLVDAALASWSALTALLIAMGRLSASNARRTAPMLACVLLLFGEPLAMLMIHGTLVNGAWDMRISPFETVWAISESPVKFDDDPWGWHVAGAALAAACGWAALGVYALMGPRRLAWSASH